MIEGTSNRMPLSTKYVRKYVNGKMADQGGGIQLYCEQMIRADPWISKLQIGRQIDGTSDRT